MAQLIEMSCEVVGKDSLPASEEEIRSYLLQIPDWETITQDGVQQLRRVFKFKNFVSALAFTTRVGEMAEAEDHHPALLTEWGRVTVRWWTHVVKGLHRNDFIAAAKTDQLYAHSDGNSD